MSERISNKSENEALEDRVNNLEGLDETQKALLKWGLNNSHEIYKTLVEVFRGYLETTLTANIWFYAFTGAVVTFYLNDKPPTNRFLRFALLLPIFISILSIYLCYRGIRRAEELECKMLGETYKHGDETPCELLKRMIKRRRGYEVEHEPPTNFLISSLNATILLVSVFSIGVAALFIGSFF